MHKISLLVVALIATTALTGCSSQPRVHSPVNGRPPMAAVRTPSVITGTLYSENSIKLPATSVVTVTLSVVETGKRSTRVLAQKVEKLAGRTFPLHYQLPLDNLVIEANSKAMLTAAVSDNHHVIMVSQSLQPITTSSSQKHDLSLATLTNVAIKSAK